MVVMGITIFLFGLLDKETGLEGRHCCARVLGIWVVFWWDCGGHGGYVFRWVKYCFESCLWVSSAGSVCSALLFLMVEEEKDTDGY